MKVIIIDDEPLARLLLREYLETYPDIELVGECSDGFEGFKAIQLHHPDLIFLDIQMPKITGFEMLEMIDDPPKIIFTTAFEDHAIKAFEMQAIDYLLKPFSKERFDKAMSGVKIIDNNKIDQLLIQSSSFSKLNDRIVVKQNNRIKIIPLSQVQYLEAADDYVKIFTSDGNYLKRQTMHYFENCLPAHEFIRIHRSYLLNTQLITRLELHEKESHEVLLTNGIRLPVSKAGYIKLKEVLGI